MKHIKPYQIFESKEPHPGFPTTGDEIHRLCKECEIENYTINDDLSIDVHGSVFINSSNLDFLPLNFNYVSGDLSCSMNELTTLKGAPNSVGGSFSCSGNKLITLKHAPNKVNGFFKCSDNKLTSLLYIPKEVGGNLYCYNNPIYSLINKFIINDNLYELLEEFNDYNIVQGNTVILGRLEAFINDFDLEMPNLDEVKEYYKIV